MVYSQPRNIFVKRDVKLTEPPDAEPHVRWCERSAAKAVSYSIDNSLIYGITGGVPHYINKLDVRDSVDEALLDNLFDRSSYLYEEPGNLLKQELRDPVGEDWKKSHKFAKNVE